MPGEEPAFDACFRYGPRPHYISARTVTRTTLRLHKTSLPAGCGNEVFAANREQGVAERGLGCELDADAETNAGKCQVDLRDERVVFLADDVLQLQLRKLW